jgi:hypothetical protein
LNAPVAVSLRLERLVNHSGRIGGDPPLGVPGDRVRRETLLERDHGRSQPRHSSSRMSAGRAGGLDDRYVETRGLERASTAASSERSPASVGTKASCTWRCPRRRQPPTLPVGAVEHTFVRSIQLRADLPGCEVVALAGARRLTPAFVQNLLVSCANYLRFSLDGPRMWLVRVEPSLSM